MAYIDIDNDETTFSSSSAQLNLTTSTTKKVIYAGLYWSALYKYESGIRDKKWNYIAVDNKRTSVNEIKFKLPGKSDYIDIAGEVLFDGLEVKNFKESAPYAAYADVTRYIQSLENPNGDYSWRGYLDGYGTDYPVVMTYGANSVFATVTTPKGSYTLVSVSGSGWIYKNPSEFELSQPGVEDHMEIPHQHK